MTKETNNLKLNKPELDDHINLTIPALANNFEIIDENINDLKSKTSQHRDYLDVLESNIVDQSNQLTDISINVKTLGAKGDGVTDDTVAIQSAISTGKHVFFPKGQYLIKDILILGHGQILKGSSVQESKIIQTTNNIPIIRIVGAHYRVEDLYLGFQNQQNDDSSGGVGIELGDSSVSYAGAHEGIIRSVIIEKPYRGIAIPTWGGQPFAFMNIFENVRVLDAFDYAFHFGGRLNIGLTTNTFRNCYALFQSVNTNPRAKGFYIAMHDDFVMENCAVDHAMEEALTLEYNKGGTITSFHAEGCRFSKNFQSLIKVNQSKARFLDLQLPFNIATDAITSEAYFVTANLNSYVVIDNLTERDTELNGNGTIFTVVNDNSSYIKIDRMDTVQQSIFNGNSSIETRVGQSNLKPTVGKWKRRDIVLNNFPSANRPLGWVCLEGGEFGTTTPPYFVPFGLVSSDPDNRNYEMQHLTVDSLEVLSGFHFKKLTGYNQSSNAGFDIGATNADAVDSAEIYNYNIHVEGNSTGQIFKIRERRRGTSNPIDSLSISKHEIDTHKKRMKNFVLDAATVRPSNPVIGQCFFDAELGRPIWYNGTIWVDSTGIVV